MSGCSDRCFRPLRVTADRYLCHLHCFRPFPAAADRKKQVAFDKARGASMLKDYEETKSAMTSKDTNYKEEFTRLDKLTGKLTKVGTSTRLVRWTNALWVLLPRVNGCDASCIPALDGPSRCGRLVVAIATSNGHQLNTNPCVPPPLPRVPLQVEVKAQMAEAQASIDSMPIDAGGAW